MGIVANGTDAVLTSQNLGLAGERAQAELEQDAQEQLRTPSFFFFLKLRYHSHTVKSTFEV